MENLDGKCVVLGVTGGIAAYKWQMGRAVFGKPERMCMSS